MTSPKKASGLKISNRMNEIPQMRNFQGNPDLASEFEYLHRLGHKRQNTVEIPALCKYKPYQIEWFKCTPDVKFSGEHRSDVRI